ncbi:phosphohydrolase [Candidatus Kuenenbacteria bacterium RIFCSPLOWO2_12_FULL_42_13]|uniref:Metal dependent phosphohydrolase n=4 Tax=Candidatus Kueneniibacteriota TaxID=1752740 RepID=A0A0G1BWV6_9BACT|nr:MAG: Metal dependent phosphohydrolase [Candidatus Kuenenbacteria bacterium GW2011_GWA2_42_15]OGG89637.1 MAG: phosphohydrolase [Candidatus Kuenenbacteria bacterium RIFCSPHIGHO2_02_FULL_42_29]OGG90583.1 MAG: phosphohydrolase [Candidatus Kuenenbacteria bacterium RIFCSPLOWO2_02_FULL_42_16]OGG91964.1 MAG: phosphohydrolase [Candidatus Kuenenbacteria bacterium RIFCSPLOWO2_12_FULL_42_13]OGG98591.1 MAG: phosphohydrolase [Candidatus Kuenenbacteria bacterium RIFCSPHIGHO2_12_FULL_42_14]
MNKKIILKETENYVMGKLLGEGSGHDWWHIYRVRRNAVLINKQEKADSFIIQLAALLHDISDWKFNEGNDDLGPRLARKWLKKFEVKEDIIAHVCEVIKEMSFRGAGVRQKMRTKEGMIVQDADRLDAIGAIGIARVFAYGGRKGREIYNPNAKPTRHNSFEEYKNNQSTSINHFYEKLIFLKDLMNTKTAKKIATDRHEFMKQFLDRFYKEWQGKE